MAKSQRVVMSISASEYQSLIVRVKELEETVAELKRDNDEKAKIIAEQIRDINSQIYQLNLLVVFQDRLKL